MFAEEARSQTTYWLADADRPSVRRDIVRIPHAAGWSGRAALSPDGRWIALTRLPPGEIDPDHAGELWEASVYTREARLLTTGVDLRSALVWSPAGDSVTFGRASGGVIELWRRSISGNRDELLAIPASTQFLTPIGYRSGEGALLCARFSEAGTDLIQIKADGQISASWHVADGTARNLILSSGGEAAFIATTTGQNNPEYQAGALDVESDQVRQVRGRGEATGVAWTPDGHLTIGFAGEAPTLRDQEGRQVLASAADGFEQPLAWSWTGRHLAVRLFSGRTTAEPGSARDAIRSREGSWQFISDAQPVRFLGWIPNNGSDDVR